MKRAAAVDWNPTGTPVAWFYDPPWAIPFLRRNDVAVPVAATLTASSGRWQDRTEGAPTSAATSSRRFSVSSWSCPFGWAATAFHLLTGTQPFKHSNPAVVISRHLNSPLPALADTRAELPALDPVLAVALAKNPDDRFARCADFAHALAEQAAPGDASSAAPTTPARASRKAASPAAQPPGKSAAVCGSPKRWLTLAIALAAIVLASAVALAWHPCSADLVPVLVSPRRVGVVVLVVEFLLLFALFLGRLGGVFWRGRRIVVWFHRNRVSR